MNRRIVSLLTLVLLSAHALAQHRNRRENKSLLGVVTAPAKKGVEILYVLPKSPAAKAKLAVGDILTEVAGAKLNDPMNLDDALRDVKPGTKVGIEYTRKKKKLSAKVAVVERKKFKGKFLRSPGRGKLGIDAPEWIAFDWGNVKKKQKPPSRANTSGRVIVIHAFQGW